MALCDNPLHTAGPLDYFLLFGSLVVCWCLVCTPLIASICAAIWYDCVFLSCVSEKHASGDTACNSSVYPVAMELGESGIISVDTHDFMGAGPHKACLLQLQGCYSCYFDLHILGSNFPPCQVNETELPKYPTCIPE